MKEWEDYESIFLFILNKIFLCFKTLITKINTVATAYLWRMRMLAYFSRMRMCRLYAYANSYTDAFISFHMQYAYARMKMWQIRCGHCKFVWIIKLVTSISKSTYALKKHKHKKDSFRIFYVNRQIFMLFFISERKFFLF